MRVLDLKQARAGWWLVTVQEIELAPLHLKLQTPTATTAATATPMASTEEMRLGSFLLRLAPGRPGLAVLPALRRCCWTAAGF